MAKKQKTIKKEISISGIGLHTGCQADLTFKPAPENAGINFVRIDLPQKPVIRAQQTSILRKSNIPRCTALGAGESVIYTVEHLMSVLCGLEIDNLIVEINAEEVPGMDGCGKEFLKAIKKAGIVEQEAAVNIFRIQKPIGVQNGEASIYIVPADEFRISYTLDYDNPYLRSQFFDVTVNKEVYEAQIASCRTFCLESEANELRAIGLGKGASYENTLVVGDDGIKDNTACFDNEFARHKVLDLIGDLYLLGMPIYGHIFAIKSGHKLNLQLLKKINQQKKENDKRGIVVGYEVGDKKEIAIDEVMKILPHRYPFLLVDRVYEIEKGKRAIGIKNVTINDNFFQGHFPTRPVMPGVLMVEAMAQTAGVAILAGEGHRGKVAFFTAIDNAKFRKVVIPGDQLVMEVEVIKDKERVALTHGVAKVGNDVVAEADMMFSFTDASYLNT